MRACVDLFVFDLAGTMVVDADHVLLAFVDTATAFELTVDERVLRARMGWHKEHVFATLLRENGRDPQAAAAMARRFEEEFLRQVVQRPLRPTRGASAALLALHERGVKVAFNTGFSRATADTVLKAMGWASWPSVASDEVEHGRPAPDLIQRAMQLTGITNPARVGVAGDTPADLLAGAAAHCGLIVGFGCGTHSLPELARHPHTHLLADPSSLAEVVFTDG